jgi:hypothetical protein
MTKEHLQQMSVVDRLRLVEDKSHSVHTALFGDERDQRGGVIGEFEVIKTEVKSLQRSFWIAFGGISVINLTIVPILIGLIIWFLTTREFNGHKSWINSETAKSFAAEMFKPTPKGNL